jgi:hypothetical protein
VAAALSVDRGQKKRRKKSEKKRRVRESHRSSAS